MAPDDQATPLHLPQAKGKAARVLQLSPLINSSAGAQALCPQKRISSPAASVVDGPRPEDTASLPSVLGEIFPTK